MGNEIRASMREKASEFLEDPKKKMGEWWRKRRVWWDKIKFKHPWWACSLQYGGLALFVLLVGHILSGILSGMANVDYFRYPLSETFRHPFNLSANLTINRTPNMQGTEIYAAEMYADNARSILCTLVGSEAAIVAIVVSLTLIAIEFTASEYSPRVIDISLKNPDMWFLLLIYGVAIFSSIILLKQLPYESRFPSEDVSLAFWLGVFSYVALVPYLRNTIRLFDPTNIVRLVSADIEKYKLLKYIKDLKETSKEDETDSAKETSRTKGDTEGHEENPIQPILDIVYRSINNYDLETVRNGLGEIVKLAEKVIGEYNRDNAPGKDNEKLLKKQMRFSKHFCDPLRRISGLAASKDDEGSTREVIKTLQTIGEKTADEKLNAATEQVAVTLGAVGKISVGKGKAFEDAVSEVAKSLEEVGKAAVGEGLEEATIQVASSLGAVGETAIQKGTELEKAVVYVLKSLKDIGMQVLSTRKTHGKIAARIAGLEVKSLNPPFICLLRGKTDARKNGFEEVIKQVAFYLGSVGKSAAENKLDEATKEAALSLEAVGKTAADNGLKKATEQAAELLGVVGEDAAKNQLDKVTEQAAESLGVVGEDAAKNQLDKATEQAAKSLGAVGKAAANNGLKAATSRAISSLEVVGSTAAENKLKDATKDAASALGKVGTTAAGKGKELEDAVKQVASALGAVGKRAAENGKGFDKATGEVAKTLGAVGVSAAGSILEDVTKDAVKNLLEIGNKAKEKELKDALKNVISSLTSIGTKAAEKKLEFAVTVTVTGLCSFIDPKFAARMSQIARALQAVGEASIENELEEQTKTAVCCLLRLKNIAKDKSLNIAKNDADKSINVLLTKPNNEIVKIAIDKCK